MVDNTVPQHSHNKPATLGPVLNGRDVPVDQQTKCGFFRLARDSHPGVSECAGAVHPVAVRGGRMSVVLPQVSARSRPVP